MLMYICDLFRAKKCGEVEPQTDLCPPAEPRGCTRLSAVLTLSHKGLQQLDQRSLRLLLGHDGALLGHHTGCGESG